MSQIQDSDNILYKDSKINWFYSNLPVDVICSDSNFSFLVSFCLFYSDSLQLFKKKSCLF